MKFSNLRTFLFTATLAVLGTFASRSADAATLDFTPAGLQAGSINSALFEEIDPTTPAGTGFIQSFVRVQATGNATVEEGFNTDARPVQFDEKTDPNFTRSVRLADLLPVVIDGTTYYQFLLDINEPNGGNQSELSLTQLQVFASAQGDLGAAGKLYNTATQDFDALATKVYDVNSGGTGYVLLDDTNAGSGRADMIFSVPTSAFDGMDPNTTYVYLVSRFGDVIGDDDSLKADGGFEEWAARVGVTLPPVPPAAPSIELVKTGVFIPGTSGVPVASDVFGLAHQFNALIFGNLQAENGDTDGRLAVAGSATFVGGYGVGTPVKGRSIPVATNGAVDRLIVGNDLHDGDWQVNGNIVVQGQRSGPTRYLTNGNLLRTVDPITFDANGNVPDDGSGVTFTDLRNNLVACSAALGAMKDRGVVEKDLYMSYRADLVGNDATLNVFNVSSTLWSRTSSSINITAPAGSTVVVNIHGPVVNISNSGMQLNGVSLEKVVYNYVDATELHTTNFAHLGSVLAPNAAAEFVAGSIDGRAVLRGPVQTSNGFEFHNFAFTGEVEIPTPGTPPSIHYTFTVTNTGGLPLENVHVEDPMVTVNGSPISLDPGATDSSTFTADYFPTDAEIANGTLSNTATATGSTSTGETVSDSDTFVLTFPGYVAPSFIDEPSGPSVTNFPTTAPAAPAASAPTVDVTGQTSIIVGSSTYTLHGTAADADGNLAGVEVKVGGRSYKAAHGSSSWTFRVKRLHSGVNVIYVRAVDTTGLSSKVKLTIERQ